MTEGLPVFGVCGYGASGKTTLIKGLVAELRRDGLAIAVVKHCGHGPDCGDGRKDSGILFDSGADVFLRGPDQSMCRVHPHRESPLSQQLRDLVSRYDVVLVEGHKSAALPHRIWLLREEDNAAPPEASGAELVLPWRDNRLEAALPYIRDGLESAWRSTPVYAGILIGGSSGRMGQPKHLIRSGKKTWGEILVEQMSPYVAETVILGAGVLPSPLHDLKRLPDIPDRQGPLAGMLSAMRWQPRVTWIFAACDLPLLTADAVNWLLGTRRPGVWATLPILPGSSWPEPMLAHYDFRARPLLEGVSRPGAIASFPAVVTPTPPARLEACWRNFNSPMDLDSLNP